MALDKNGYEYEVDEGGGAFYGPKIDFNLKDSLGRDWQLGTVQLDMNLPERFDISYIGEDGSRLRPIMLHRAILGSIERFFGILIEHYAGKLPVWLAPVKAVIIPISEKHIEYADKIYEEFKKAGIKAEKDYSNESMQKRIREAQLQKVPYMILVGQKEEEQNLISIRTRDNAQENGIKLEDFINKIKTKISARDLDI
jgi:threonyl-tRNA synthetase